MEPLIRLFLTSVMSGRDPLVWTRCHLHATESSDSPLVWRLLGADPFRCSYLWAIHINTFTFPLLYTCGLILNVCMVKWRWIWFIMALLLLCYFALHGSFCLIAFPLEDKSLKMWQLKPQRKLTSIKKTCNLWNPVMCTPTLNHQIAWQNITFTQHTQTSLIQV